jgi:Cysteine-rich CPCC
MATMVDDLKPYPCPCCGYLVFEEESGSYSICPICFWEDDLTQLRFAYMGGGANRVSLFEGQRAYAALGACEARFVAHVRRPTDADRREAGWRSLDPMRDNIEDAQAMPHAAQTYPEDSTTLYYWRDTYWRHQRAPACP